MTEQLQVAGRPQVTGPPGTSPERGRGAWPTALLMLALLAGLAVVVTLIVLVDPSAGAAGGCGGG